MFVGNFVLIYPDLRNFRNNDLLSSAKDSRLLLAQLENHKYNKVCLMVCQVIEELK